MTGCTLKWMEKMIIGSVKLLSKMKYALSLLVGLLLYTNAQAWQSTSLPTLDTLFEQVATVSFDIETGFEPGARHLVQGNWVFAYNHPDYAYNLANGQRAYFKQDSVQALFRAGLQDSLLVLDTENYFMVRNLYTGKVLMNKQRLRPPYFGPDLRPRLTNDSLVSTITASSKTQFYAKVYYAANGRMLWQKPLQTIPATYPLVYGNRIYIFDQQRIYMHNLQNGQQIRQQDLGPQIAGRLHIYQNKLLVWVAGTGLIAMDPDNLQPVWTFGNDQLARGNYELSFKGDSIYFAKGAIYTINAQNGQLVNKFTQEYVSGGSEAGFIDPYLFLCYEKGGDVYYMCAYNTQTNTMVAKDFTSAGFPADPDAEKGFHILEHVEPSLSGVSANGQTVVLGTANYIFILKRKQ